MNEDIIKKIKNYPIDIDGQTREHIISLGKEQIITNQIKQHSYFNLFLSTLRFISVRSWIAQFIILICAIFITSNLSSLHSINEIMQILTFILIAEFRKNDRPNLCGSQWGKYYVQSHKP